MRNLTMLTDFYQLTMLQGYYSANMHTKQCVFDFFFRKKSKIHYCIFAGLEQILEVVENLKFEKEDIEYLRSFNCFTADFLNYLSEFSFHGDIYSVKEGEVVFPDEPIVTVVASLAEAQLIETVILNILNHQTLIATKASRIKQVAGDCDVLEFGLRRAHGPDAAMLGARASIIGGCVGTSNVRAGKYFDLEVRGTLAHSFVQSFDSELDAFRAYAKDYPDKCLLLLDTYDTLRSGLVNAITVFKELEQSGNRPLGVRIDSGDLAYLSKKIRKALDENGFSYCKICASGDLDEFSIQSLIMQGAKIDIFCVGTRLITSEDMPSLGGVYKLASIQTDTEDIQVLNGKFMTPKMKLSENSFKTTNPAFKKIIRIYDKDKMAQADLIMLREEVIDESKPLTIFDPVERWKKTTFYDYSTREIVEKVMENGKRTGSIKTIDEIIDYSKKTKETFWTEYKRIDAPHIYKVDLSTKLLDCKENLIEKINSTNIK